MAVLNKSKFGIDNQELLRIAAKAPMLEKEHELGLARRWRESRDQAALAALTRSYLRLVIAMAGRFRAYGLPLADLVQEGVVGLMEAASRFEPDREIRFSTYASWWVRSAMQDYILRNWSIVRTGTTAAHKSLFFNLRRLKQQISGDQDAPMSLEARQALAKKLGVRVRDVDVMEARLLAADRSLNSPRTEEGESQWQDFIPCEAPLPDEALEAVHDAQVKAAILREAMAELSAREMTILRERRLSEGGVTLSSLGEKLGISKERVRQIENQALAKLKSALLARVKDPISAGLVNSIA
jgi:RNA polymerase sigma-32 factor